MSRLDLIRDESGTTLLELLVAIAAGAVVIFGIALAVIVTLRETDRVTSHVDANQRARVTMTKIMNELHSACVAPQISPIREKSSETLLAFWHQTGSEVAPTPTLSKISLSGTTLSQSDYAANGGAAPNWTFSETTPTSTVQLMNNVSAIPGIPLFRYYAYGSGRVSATSVATPLTTESARSVVQVNVAFQTAPQSTPLVDAKAKTGIQSAALLRLTPPSYSSTASNLPCQ
jgi:hypothetical protein